MKNHDILNEASIVQRVRNAALFLFIYSNQWDAKFQHDVISVHSAVTIQNIQNNNNNVHPTGCRRHWLSKRDILIGYVFGNYDFRKQL